MDSDKDTKTAENLEAEKTEESVEELAADVPAVDPDAPLKIDQAKEASTDVPETNLKAPLKVEEAGEKEEDSRQEKSNEQALSPQEQGNKKLFIFGGVVVGIIILATVGFFIFSAKQPEAQKTITPQTETSTPKPTEAPKLNRADWSFEVLNGSGVAGAAKKLADELTALGYQVVKTGNADKQTYEGNQLIVTRELETKAELVAADLKDTIKIATIAATLEDSTASARIILGKDRI